MYSFRHPRSSSLMKLSFQIHICHSSPFNRIYIFKYKESGARNKKRKRVREKVIVKEIIINRTKNVRTNNSPLFPGTNPTDQAIPICPSIVTSEWKSVLRPISYHNQVDMIRSLRDFKTMNQQRQPLTTLNVRWQENRTGFTYSSSHLEYIFGHFGKVINVSPQSPSSAHVTFNSIAGACRAISMKNIGVERYPLHVCWLPKAWQNRYWVKKETIPKAFVITNKENPIKRAISHQGQIHCRYHVCSVKGCPNKAVFQF